MPTIVLAYSEECKKELLEKGFREETVMVKFGAVDSKEQAEKKIWEMRRRPYQFLCSNTWGACAD